MLSFNNHLYLVSDGDRLIDILSTIPKAEIVPKAGIRYHVFGEVLDNRDFQSLKGNNWLTDTVRIYLVLLASFILERQLLSLSDLESSFF